ncbi:hypothetical protein [Ornithinimicrobium panacihumi]|uniref:hypothetical protein n=1 Tax=Ornithinimicrobium panacihumi TaxID=2008449 RepID=UPI003F8B5C86
MALTIPKDNTGLSLPYRVLWRTKYILLTFMGPADQHGMRDPRFQMRSQRWAKVRAAREAKGLPPLPEPEAHANKR